MKAVRIGSWKAISVCKRGCYETCKALGFGALLSHPGIALLKCEMITHKQVIQIS